MANADNNDLATPLEVELAELLGRHGIDDKLAREYLARMRAVVAVQEVAAHIGRPLNRDERKRAHVQHMAGKSVAEIAASLAK